MTFRVFLTCNSFTTATGTSDFQWVFVNFGQHQAQPPPARVDVSRADALRTLGLDEDASQVEIRRAYRRLARRTHPDAGGDAAEFRRVRAAFEALGK